MNENILFIVLALAITAAVVLVLMSRLLRPGQAQAASQDAANAKVYKEQLAELEAERLQGKLSDEDYAQGRDELTRRLLEDTREETAAEPAAPQRSFVAALVVAVSLPLAALATYGWLGEPDGLSPQKAAAHNDKHPDLEAMAASLASKLESDSGNVQRWVMLGRTYRALEQYDKALEAYQKALGLGADDDIALERAEILAQKNGGSFEGEPWRVIRQVLAKNARHYGGVLLGGSAAYAEGNYPQAIAYWTLAREQLDADDQDAPGLDNALNKARQKLGLPVQQAPSVAPGRAASAEIAGVPQGKNVAGKVVLDPAWQAQVAPTDTVFIYALPASGERMPLAIKRSNAGSLPMDFVLDDASAMDASRKLSAQDKVIVKVRISRSGEAMPRPGDLTGVSAPVAVGTQHLKITINEQVK